MLKKLFFILSISIFLLGCNNPNTPLPDDDYVPIEAGTYFTDDVLTGDSAKKQYVFFVDFPNNTVTMADHFYPPTGMDPWIIGSDIIPDSVVMGLEGIYTVTFSNGDIFTIDTNTENQLIIDVNNPGSYSGWTNSMILTPTDPYSLEK